MGFGYSLEPPIPGGSNVYTQSMFLAKLLKTSQFLLIFSVFTAEKYMYFAWESFLNVVIHAESSSEFSLNAHITKTCPCNIQRFFFSAEKLKIFS